MFKKVDKWKVFYALVFVTGLTLMILEIGIYRVTVISPTLYINNKRVHFKDLRLTRDDNI